MRQPVGVGDVTSGLLLVKLLQGATLQEALEHVTAAVYEIMVTTKAMQEYELQVVAAQDRIAKPEHISAQQSSEISHFGPQRPVGRWLLL
ncbi:pyridoxamine kinase [Escherichia coli]|uniref:Pyridoxamine kinase n=1 Tax=Escherichia coli TaxID=562 RepID=A0A376S785_ECOLX|nr:pyridoxamine kinase [Escherichia coli]